MNGPSRELCGLHGKLPQQADFVCLHLAEGFVEGWHGWLQAGLSVSREQLAEAWLETYLTSPVWRFALGPGVCGDDAAVGVLVPSVDEVGRYYPLTVAHCGAHQPWPAYLAGGGWFEAAERVALAPLGNATGYMELVERLESLPPPELDGPPVLETAPAALDVPATAWMMAPDGIGPGSPLLTALLDRAYRRLLGGFSLWWSEGSERVQPCLLVSAGLPDPGRFAAMLDGNWQRWGWLAEQAVTAPDEVAG